jgi:D-beta-D-heptose 7-phosphate kinase/D-beta-D-heptose 1-phosphate adenosyltransferase
MAQATRNVKDIFKHESNLKNRLVKNHNELDTLVKYLKQGGYKIVLTQGVYDLIHEGHARYLEAARSHGDILIVGVDSDALTKKRKGPNRPIVPQNERLNMLAHLRAVDILVVRDVKDDIGDLIRLVKPDVYVASESTKDFTKELRNVYKPHCGKIVVLPPQATTSTTARIRNLTIEGAEELAREVNKLTSDFLNKIKNA